MQSVFSRCPWNISCPVKWDRDSCCTPQRLYLPFELQWTPRSPDVRWTETTRAIKGPVDRVHRSRLKPRTESHKTASLHWFKACITDGQLVLQRGLCLNCGKVLYVVCRDSWRNRKVLFTQIAEERLAKNNLIQAMYSVQVFTDLYPSSSFLHVWMNISLAETTQFT